MKFHEKLNLLLNMFNITNYQLAERLQVDVSLISRWRTGNRLPSDRSSNLEDLADHIIQVASRESELYSLMEQIGMPVNAQSEDTGSLHKTLISWFKDESTTKDLKLIHQFMEKLDFFSYSSYMEPEDILQPQSSDYSISNVYKGIQGKREGILRFLNETLRMEPTTICMYSDEPLSWLTGDIEFYMKWTKLLPQLLRKGHKVILVHSVEKDLAEITTVIEKWLPLYMSGNVESYYYPKLQGSPFRHTLFVAGESAALTSASLINMSDSALNNFHTDKDRILPLRETFQSLITLCQPLMKIYTDNNRIDYFNTLLEGESVFSDTYSFSQSISTITLPVEIISDVHKNAGWMKEKAEAFLLDRQELFKNNLISYKFVDIISLPSVEDIIAERVILDLSHFFPGGPIPYKPEQYRLHLLNVISILENYENYHVILLNQKLFSDIKILIRKNVFSIISKYSPRPVTMYINYEGITDGLYDYINERIKEADQKAYDRNQVLLRLKALLSELNQKL
jgi:transcriptional regulator with XRE-family HTH domain